MPATLYLQQFADIVSAAFDGKTPYHVGSSLTQPTWRDVDVRIMLDKEQYAAMGFGDPERPHENEKWCAYTMAFSVLGQQITGLPIDFQVQETETANRQYNRKNEDQRSALILYAVRRSKQNENA